jgi:hypothetical protein
VRGKLRTRHERMPLQERGSQPCPRRYFSTASKSPGSSTIKWTASPQHNGETTVRIPGPATVEVPRKQ